MRRPQLQLRRLLLVTGLLTALVLATMWPWRALPTRADTPTDYLTISPTSGPPGTMVTFTPSPTAQTYAPDSIVQPQYFSTCSSTPATLPSFLVGANGTLPDMTVTIPTTETAPCDELDFYAFVYPPGQPNGQPLGAYGTYKFVLTTGSAPPPPVSGNGTDTPTAGIPPTAPTITLSPLSAAPGQPVTVSGTGFAPSAQVTIGGLGTTPTYVQTDGTGAFSTALLLAAGLSGQTVQVTASDAFGHAAAASLAIVNNQSPVLSASSSTAAPGQQLSVSGTNFTAGDQVSVSLALPGAPTSPLPGTTQVVQVPTSLAFTLSYTIPAVAPGSYLLIAQGTPSNRSASVALTVQSSSTSLSASPTPTSSGGFQLFATATTTSAVATTTSAVVGFPTTTPLPAIPATATAPRTPTATATPRVTLSQTTYFAEGYTGQAAANKRASFQEELFLFNTTQASVSAVVSYYVVTGSNGTTRTFSRPIHLGPLGLIERSVNADAGANQSVSIIVHHTPGVTARVVIARTDPHNAVLDAAATLGSPRAATTWSFAEGYAGLEFQEYLNLFNPSPAPAHTHVRFLTAAGASPVTLSYTVPASGRLSANVGGLYLQRAGIHAPKSIAISVSSDQPIVVDRTLYWGSGSGSGKYGYEITPGTTAGAISLLFPVLSPTSASETYITVLNPTTTRAGLQIVFRSASGQVVTSYTNTVAPLARLTVPVRSAVPVGTTMVSASLNTTVPVVAEEALYTTGSPNTGTHAGVDLPGVVASGSIALAGIDSKDATLYIYNPSQTALQVTGVFGSAAGNAGQGVIDVPPLHISVITIPNASGSRGLLLTASTAFTAALINGVAGSAAWGSVFPPTS